MEITQRPGHPVPIVTLPSITEKVYGTGTEKANGTE